MNPKLIKTIDQVRAKGATPDKVKAVLKAVGEPYPEIALAAYMRTPLPDGRLRGQVNPGDPDEALGA